jgi:16S rRNA (guanine527-N7)-methyltransferase
VEIILKYFSDFSPKQLDHFTQLEALYKEWNEKINVISRKNIDGLYEQHVLHSLAIAAMCPFTDGAQILDIGTGGGFPGIPLAIFFPEVEFLLIDGIGKKIKVVQEVASAIGLKNVTAVHGRAEEIKGRMFDFAVSRAVAPLADLWRWTRPLIKAGHKSEDLQNGLICLKGGNLRQEIADSGLKPRLWQIHEIFPEPFFEEKFMVYVQR